MAPPPAIQAIYGLIAHIGRVRPAYPWRRVAHVHHRGDVGASVFTRRRIALRVMHAQQQGPHGGCAYGSSANGRARATAYPPALSAALADALSRRLQAPARRDGPAGAKGRPVGLALYGRSN
eukprot:1760880-Pleurochrysis_carterae.AAC.3